MDLMINPATRVSSVRMDDDKIVKPGEKVIVNKAEAEEMLEVKKWGMALWVEFVDYTDEQAPDEADNAEGDDDTSDKEE